MRCTAFVEDFGVHLRDAFVVLVANIRLGTPAEGVRFLMVEDEDEVVVLLPPF
jgi:hypothetical protein